MALDGRGYIVGKIENLSRLISLGRFIFFFYSVITILFIIIVGAIGLYIFKDSDPAIWRTQWIVLVIFSALNLFFLPFISMLEGCGQIRHILKFRIIQSLISNLVLWSLVATGFGLWAFVISAIFVFIRDIYLFGVKYSNFFKPFFNEKSYCNCA